MAVGPVLLLLIINTAIVLVVIRYKKINNNKEKKEIISSHDNNMEIKNVSAGSPETDIITLVLVVFLFITCNILVCHFLYIIFNK